MVSKPSFHKLPPLSRGDACPPIQRTFSHPPPGGGNFRVTGGPRKLVEFAPPRVRQREFRTSSNRATLDSVRNFSRSFVSRFIIRHTLRPFLSQRRTNETKTESPVHAFVLKILLDRNEKFCGRDFILTFLETLLKICDLKSDARSLFDLVQIYFQIHDNRKTISHDCVIEKIHKSIFFSFQ